MNFLKFNKEKHSASGKGGHLAETETWDCLSGEQLVTKTVGRLVGYMIMVNKYNKSMSVAQKK